MMLKEQQWFCWNMRSFLTLQLVITILHEKPPLYSTKETFTYLSRWESLVQKTRQPKWQISTFIAVVIFTFWKMLQCALPRYCQYCNFWHLIRIHSSSLADNNHIMQKAEFSTQTFTKRLTS